MNRYLITSTDGSQGDCEGLSECDAKAVAAAAWLSPAKLPRIILRSPTAKCRLTTAITK